MTSGQTKPGCKISGQVSRHIVAHPHHRTSVMPAVVLVATMSRLGHCLKSCMLENTQRVPSHIRPVKAEEARTKLPSARNQSKREQLKSEISSESLLTLLHLKGVCCLQCHFLKLLDMQKVTSGVDKFSRELIL